MKFPGRRKHKHYFPVQDKNSLIGQFHKAEPLQHSYIVGIDQVLVDIEAKVGDEFLERYNLKKGMSQLIEDDVTEALYAELQEKALINYEFAGGTIGNTLHNYSVLADDRSVLLGVMSENIKIGSYSYKYLSNTSSRVDLNYLQPVDGPIGRCFTLIDSQGERTFAISPAMINKLSTEYVDKEVIQNASALVFAAYSMRTNPGDTMTEATLKAVEYANEAGVPVVLTLGTKFLIEQNPEWWQEFVKKHVDILTMNEEEAEAITGIQNPLLAASKALDWVDMVMCTAGPVGLYMAGHCDKKYLRETEQQFIDAEIAEFNRYEYSRPMRLQDCEEPVKVYSYIPPYMGGPDKIMNTNGAGDGALAAVLHDICANEYHKLNVEKSTKHEQPAITYSSLSQISKYANRVSYEVLAQHSPRLSKGLPEREEVLDMAYWAT
ncbi:inosine/guanosine kinase [Planctobacterium marinum]|uniref:Guanosine-inosine kinase n=1 Tax=Planctobacterium marinum TaxID=1631968 RepID=A0AA48HU61_9ALTE|nr:inosine/guanosine kinase [Planctobacterium marinum]